MGRKKDDGKGRLGGRAKGVPNKDNAAIKNWLKKLIDDNREQLVEDFKALEPKDRISMLERFMAYVIPKQATVQAESNITVREAPQMTEEEIIEELERLRRLNNE